jgi:hypothetical protein
MPKQKTMKIATPRLVIASKCDHACRVEDLRDNGRLCRNCHEFGIRKNLRDWEFDMNRSFSRGDQLRK